MMEGVLELPKKFGGLITVPVSKSILLPGRTTIPSSSRGVILFPCLNDSRSVHRQIRLLDATFLKAGFGTAHVTLLSPEEEALDRQTKTMRYNIPLLAQRLVRVMDWLARPPAGNSYLFYCFAFHTCSAAALVASARRPELFAAIVSCRGRVDLAGSAARRVAVPVLSIIDGKDFRLLDMHRAVLPFMRGANDLTMVPGIADAYVRQRALREAAVQALGWFLNHQGYHDRGTLSANS
jgi:hypothetical protein